MSGILTPEERHEYDDLMYEAGYDEAGKARPSHEIGPSVVAMLRDAAYQANRTWAGYILDHLTESAALNRWKQWAKQREIISVRTNDGEEDEAITVSKPAAMSVRKRDLDSGRSYNQMTIWDDMSRDELLQVIASAGSRIRTDTETILTARRLVALIDRVPEAETPGQAARSLGTDVAAYLVEPEKRAS